jgi:hypothetical protein
MAMAHFTACRSQRAVVVADRGGDRRSVRARRRRLPSRRRAAASSAGPIADVAIAGDRDEDADVRASLSASAPARRR